MTTTSWVAALDKKEHKNWVMVGCALNIAKNGIAPLIQRKMEAWYQSLISSPPLQSLSLCTCAPGSKCGNCDAWKKELKLLHSSGQLKWGNSDKNQWGSPTGAWEIAKIFMSALGTRKKDVVNAETTDIGGLLNLLEWCSFIQPPVSPTVVALARDQCRNHWAHAPKQELQDADVKTIFGYLYSLLNDPVFSSDKDAQNSSKDLQDLQTNGLVNVLDSEIKALCLLRQSLVADVTKNRDSLDVLTKKVAEVKEQGELNSKVIAKLDTEVVNLQEKMSTVVRTVEDFNRQRNERVDLQEVYGPISEDVEDLKIGLQNLAKEQDTLKARLSDVANQAATNATAISSVANQAATNTATISSVANQAATNTATISSVANQAATNTATISSVANQAATNTATISSVANQAATNTATISSVANQAATNTATISSVANQAATNTATISSVANQAATNTATISSVANQAATNTATISSVANQAATNTATISSVANQAATNTATISSVANQAATNTATISSVANQAATNTATISSVGNQAATNTATISSVANQAATNTATISSVANQAATNTATISSVANQAATNAAAIASVTNQNIDDSKAIYTAPAKLKAFTGRETCLAWLVQNLTPQQSCENYAGTSCCTKTVCGLGGCGKSSLAVEFAWKCKNLFPGGVFWINGECDENIHASVVENLALLNISDFKSEKIDVPLNRFLAFLSKKKHPWLLVVDNADELGGKTCPTGVKKLSKGSWQLNGSASKHGHILLTTRQSVKETKTFLKLSPADCLELKCFSEEEGALFLMQRTGNNGKTLDKEAIDLVNELGALPLALEQAAAYISALPFSCSFKEYLEKYKVVKLSLLKEQPATALSIEAQYRLSVHTTWLMNFGFVRKKSRAAETMLNIAAFVPEEGNPIDIIYPIFSELEQEEEKSVDCEFDVAATLKVLCCYSLVSVNEETKEFRVHKLVQEMVRESLTPSMREKFKEAVHKGLRKVSTESITMRVLLYILKCYLTYKPIRNAAAVSEMMQSLGSMIQMLKSTTV